MCRSLLLPDSGRSRLSNCLAVFLLWLVLPAMGSAAPRQDEEGAVHRLFGLSRAKAAPTKPPPKPPKQPVLPGETAERLTLGYSILRAEKSSDQSVVVRAGEVFRIGERIRLLVETNADGFLYIFNAVDGKDPEMIFPVARRNAGDNRLAAHVPFEFPSRKEPESEHRWLHFFDPPGAEQLYFVLSRAPIRDIPVGKELLALCQQGDCKAMKPNEAVWKRIVAAEALPKRKETMQAGILPLSAEVNHAVARGVRVTPKAAKPTVLQQSADANQIVVIVNLESRK
jgi:Domain of unknown function (DUF4384)